MTINQNQSPYWNDYDESKNFHQVLFRPGYGVQSRELTQLQSILQNQVSRVGDHLFKQGAMVIPGNTDYDLTVDYIKIEDTYSSNPITFATMKTWVGKTFKGTSSNVEVQILAVVDSEGLNPKTLIVKLVAQGGTNSDQKLITAGEDLYDKDNPASACTTKSSDATGKSSIGYINEGVFYVNGYFVKVYQQTVVLSKYSNKPNVRVGLNVVEEIVTDSDDASLLDPAFGSSNANAPGAHRLKISLELATYGLNADVPTDFIDLFSLKAGNLLKLKDNTDYNELEKTLARRTYDESGNYTVDDFVGTLKEHLLNENDGVYLANEFTATCTTALDDNTITNILVSDGVIEPGQTISGAGIPANTFILATNGDTAILSNVVSSTGVNVLITGGGNADKLCLVVDPGKAYVGGREIKKQSTSYVNIDKARDIDHQETTFNSSTRIEYGNYILVGDLYGLPSMANKPTIELRDAPIATRGTPAGTVIGYAKFLSMELLTGTETNNITTTSAVYKVYLADITLNSGKVLENVASFSVLGSNTVAGDFVCGNVLIQINYTNNTGAFAKADTLTGAAGGSTTAIAYNVDSTNKIIYAKKNSTNPYIIQGDVFSDGTDRATALTKTQLFGVDKSSYLWKLPEDFIKAVKDKNGVRDTTYFVRKEITGTTDGAGAVTVSTTDTLMPLSTTTCFGYYTSGASKGNVFTTTTGTWTPGATSLTITGLAVSSGVTIVVPVMKSDVQERVKTFNQNVNVAIAPTAAGTLSKIHLGKVDVVRISGIYDSGNLAVAATTSDLNITDRYILDNGQRDTHYESGVLTLVSGATPPKGRVLVVLDHYSHGPGDFFTVDSYTSNANYRQDNPVYVSSNGTTHFLLDCVDFRPTLDGRSQTYIANTASSTTITLDTSNTTRLIEVGMKVIGPGIPANTTVSSITNDFRFEISNATTSSLFNQNIVILPNSGTYGYSEFDTSDNVNDVIQNGTTFTATMTYYLSRMDKVGLTSSGEFKVFKGTPAKTPSSPSVTESKDLMVLYELLVPAYTIKPTDVQVRVFDTRRYTMRDIGKLENRLENVEYYTSLSLLEKATKDMVITDPSTGLNRFKSGFVVDNFSTNFVADVENPEYNVAVDTTKEEARPAFTTGSVVMYYDESDVESVNGGVFGNSIMLPFTNVSAISQPLATTTKNINPFAVFSWQGSMTLNPAVDNWIEINQLPDIVITRTSWTLPNGRVTRVTYS